MVRFVSYLKYFHRVMLMKQVLPIPSGTDPLYLSPERVC